MVLGVFVGSMVLVPLLISLSSERRLHVPSEPLTTVSFLASSSIALLPFTSRATTLHFPSICLRSLLIAASLASPWPSFFSFADGLGDNKPTTPFQMPANRLSTIPVGFFRSSFGGIRPTQFAFI